MTSKTLHFLARSLDIGDPPVPIDNACVLDCVWPLFKGGVNQLIADGIDGRIRKPSTWRNDTGEWDRYNRYMTAVRQWAAHRGWTAEQFEQTMFYDYR